jgi:ATP-dependent RNA helicase DeaD
MTTTKDFDAMGLSPETIASVRKMGFLTATSIQEQTIPPMMEWQDIIARAPTGTGKTSAFGIPIIEHFDPEMNGLQALILCPTRELALQITEELRELAQHQPEIRIATIYGGQKIERQLDQLKHKPQIIVATPGRLIDHLSRKTIALGTVRTVVLDEADRMLDMGFVRDVRKILDKMPKAWQITMFSATMSRAVMDISWIYQRNVIELTVREDEENKPQITQYSVEIGSHERVDAIVKIVREQNFHKSIVFCNRKHVTDYVARRLTAAGCKAASIHGDIQQSGREKALNDFRNGSLVVLVATDVASRGIDVEGVDAVFNYDIPDENEYYTHRIGRTGRAKKTGIAYTFTSMMSKPRLDEIMRYTKSEIIPLAFAL